MIGNEIRCEEASSAREGICGVEELILQQMPADERINGILP